MPSVGPRSPRAFPTTGTPARRQHGRGNAGLPAGEPVPRQSGRDASGRGRRPGGAQPGQPLPRHDAPHRGAVLPARGRPRAGRRVVRARLRPRRRHRARRRWPLSSSPSSSWSPSNVTTGRAADSLIKRSLQIVAEGPFDDYWTSALVVRRGRPCRCPSRQHARGASVRAAGGPAAPAAHLRAAGRLGAGAARAGPDLPGPDRPGRGPGRAGAGPRHPAGSGPSSATWRRPPACWTSASARSPPPRRSAPRP